MSSHPHGEGIQILSFGQNRKIIVNQKILEDTLLHEEVKNRPVVILSIVGAFRKGKSFFLNYCLRFLYANYPSVNYPNNPTENRKNWIGNENDPLIGFSWKSGVARDTSGIVMWNDVFLHTDLKTGEELAIIIMDTQGLFDNQTSCDDNSRVFAIGTLISSIEVLNLLNIIQENQLQYLEFATNFAKLAFNDCKDSKKPFQNFWFIVRDWQHIIDHAYGIDGGNDYIRKILDTAGQNPAMQSVRDNINQSFKMLNCALLPHPGKVVSNGVKKSNGEKVHYDGNWKEMKGEYKNYLEQLIEFLLKPDNLVPKAINGEIVTGSIFLGYVKKYFKIFESEEIPEVKSIYELTVHEQLSKLVEKCFSSYEKLLFTNENKISSLEHIDLVHNLAKNHALIEFEKANKMGNSNHIDQYKELLKTKISNFFVHWGSKTTESIKIMEESRQKVKKEQEEKDNLIKVQAEKIRKLQQQLKDSSDKKETLILETQEKLQAAIKKYQRMQEENNILKQQNEDFKQKLAEAQIIANRKNLCIIL